MGKNLDSYLVKWKDRWPLVSRSVRSAAAIDEQEAEKRSRLSTMDEVIDRCNAEIAKLTCLPSPMPHSALAKVDAYQAIITWAKSEQEGTR